MNITKCTYICILIALVHCDNSTQHYKRNRANLIINSTVNDGSGERLGGKPRVSEKGENVTRTSAANLSKTKPVYLRSQIDIPLMNDTKLDNNTQHYVLLGQRRGVLIINRRMSRNYGKSDKPAKAESLLYEEYNDDGVKVYSYSMSNLDDVAKFFQFYLNTHICHGKCEDIPTTTIMPVPLSEK